MKRNEAFCGRCGAVKLRTEFSSMTSDRSRGNSPQFYCKVCQRIMSANPKKMKYESYEKGGYIFTTAVVLPRIKGLKSVALTTTI